MQNTHAYVTAVATMTLALRKSVIAMYVIKVISTCTSHDFSAMFASKMIFFLVFKDSEI